MCLRAFTRPLSSLSPLFNSYLVILLTRVSAFLLLISYSLQLCSRLVSIGFLRLLFFHCVVIKKVT
jgi:hypothetical protein